MRLKSLKLAGFKSFVDPIEIDFPGIMCGIVGPNGCGKSNLLDAFRLLKFISILFSLLSTLSKSADFDGCIRLINMREINITLFDIPAIKVNDLN